VIAQKLAGVRHGLHPIFHALFSVRFADILKHTSVNLSNHPSRFLVLNVHLNDGVHCVVEILSLFEGQGEPGNYTGHLSDDTAECYAAVFDPEDLPNQVPRKPYR
jgi:hypothetical protein